MALDLAHISTINGLVHQHIVGVVRTDNEGRVYEREWNKSRCDQSPGSIADIQAPAQLAQAVVLDSVDVSKLKFVKLVRQVVRVLMMRDHML